jgi:hypothetical protein
VFERRLRLSGRREDISKLRSGSFSLFLILLFLIYPGVSATILSSFLCKQFDDGSQWLRKDITINCNDVDRPVWLAIASLGVVIYVIGIPAIYLVALIRVRKEINPSDPNQVPDKTKFAPVLFLTEVYKRNFWFWEVIELFRKLLQTSLIIFFLDGSVMQFIVMMVVSMLLVQTINELKPYVHEDANRLAAIAQWEILLVSFVGLLLRVDLSQLDSAFVYNKNELLTICLIIICFIAPVYAIFQKRKEIWYFVFVRRFGCSKRKQPIQESRGENISKHDDNNSDGESYRRSQGSSMAENPIFGAESSYVAASNHHAPIDAAKEPRVVSFTEEDIASRN